jgi:hypothetical protein
MAMAQAAHRVRHPTRVKVGERVGISVGGRVLAAKVVEDRGDLGAHGEQVVRLAVEDPMIPSEHFEVEVLVDWLAAPPARARR